MEPDSTDLFAGITELNRLYDSSTARVKKLGRDRSEYNVQLTSIRQAISPAGINQQWKIIKGQLTDGGLMALGAYSEILSLLDSDGAIPEEALKKLQRQVDDLMEGFAEADVATEFARFALKQLQKVRDALFQYRFLGPEALLGALESVTGAMVGEQGVLDEAKESQKPVYEEFGSVISLLDRTIQFAERFSPYAAALMEKGYLRLAEGGS